jgi:hypothetical protein
MMRTAARQSAADAMPALADTGGSAGVGSRHDTGTPYWARLPVELLEALGTAPTGLPRGRVGAAARARS